MGGPPRSVLLARGLRALSSLGIEAGPWVERQRGRINRPVAAEVAALQAELAATQAVAAARQAGLDARLSALEAGGGPRVLYALWHYPQITEQYIETEIRAMQRRGAQVEVWSECDVASAYPPAARFHRGSLEDAIAAFRPDLVHVHWLAHAAPYAPAVAAAGLPLTVRAHGFETTQETIAATLRIPNLARIYLFPGMDAGAATGDPLLMVVPAAFESPLFVPSVAAKDRRLVVRTAAALASKELDLFLDLAQRLPHFRFVLVIGTCLLREGVPAEILAMNEARGRPAEIHVDLPREEVAKLMRQAAIYLHTALPPGQADATPIGAPISIAEAMATGALVLVRDLPALRDYVGEAGRCYRDREKAAALIAGTAAWSEAEWRRAGHVAVAHAWSRHADDVALAPIHADWRGIAGRRAAAPATREMA
ncbi:glycosyltransferase [Roseomonas sp. AR75]|uniref:glycosyltransferase n=1 Tax=Roseomonas sp. AR75 TaxID=2562311 RepID=UPI0010BFD5A9|nr:glycosyltransferase [Roseomonas sp. AR75]